MDRRASDRQLTVMLLGILEVGGTKHLCVVRNVSEGGVRLQVFRPLAAKVRVGIELKSGHMLSGKVAWANGFDVGVALDAPLDVPELLSTPWNGALGAHPRLPRIEIDHPVMVCLDGRTKGATLCDISQGGAKLNVAGGADPGCSAVLMLTGEPPILGSVRWAGEGVVGINFHERLSIRRLSDWLWRKSSGDAVVPSAAAPLRAHG